MKITLYSLILCSILAACSDEGSSIINNPPRIISFEILNSNSQILIEEGAQLQFSYELSDDKALNQFRVTIYDDFPNARLFSAPWNYEEDYSISGTNISDTLFINLPFQDIEPGNYELTLIVQDIDENETSYSKNFILID